MYIVYIPGSSIICILVHNVYQVVVLPGMYIVYKYTDNTTTWYVHCVQVHTR